MDGYHAAQAGQLDPGQGVMPDPAHQQFDPLNSQIEPVHPVFRQVKEPLDDDQFKAAFRILLHRARSHMEDVVLADVRRGWDYYRGKVDATPAQPMVDPQTGAVAYEGSKIVMTECRDTVQTMLPDLVRVYLGTERICEFAPEAEDDVEGAEQASDYLNYVFRVQNDGENLLVDMLLDWMVKFAAVKSYWKVEEKRREYPFDGLDEDALAMLQQDARDPGNETVAVEAEPYPSVITTPQQQQMPDGTVAIVHVEQPTTLYRGRVIRAEKKGRETVELIPHEEFLIDPDAPTAAAAVLVGQDCDRLVSDVVALGVPYETVEPHIGKTRVDPTGIRQERTGEWLVRGSDGTPDRSIAYVRVAECQVRLDRDGDGIAENYRVLALGTGDSVDIVEVIADDDTGWFVASPYRIPHQPIGQGVVEVTMDLQDIGTATMRSVFNSLNRSIAGREVIVDEDPQAYDDLRSWFRGPIRVTRPDAISFHSIPFEGQNALPILDILELRRARRTGISDAGAGLDPDVMKGQTVAGAHSIVAAPQSRMEFLVREFGMGLLRPLFRHLLVLSTRYQDKSRIIRLRDKWVPVDPRSWNAEMDCMPRVGLGTGTKAERFAALQLIAAKQEALLATGSPLVTLPLYRNTLVGMAELAGEKDTSRYFAQVDDQTLQQHAAQAQQSQQAAMAQQTQAAAAVEGAKAQARGQAQVQSAVQVAQVQAAHDSEMQQMRVQADEASATRDAQLQASLQSQQQQFQYNLKSYELQQEKELEMMKMHNKERSGQGNLPTVSKE